jgi:uncharacterized protein with HEPN domain
VCGQREPLLYVNDMVEAAERIVAVCAGIPAEQILDDVDRADIVLWRLTVLGEAAKSVSPAFRAEYPEVGWSEAARLRDRIVHHCEGLDPDRIAEVVGGDIPRLLTALRPVQARLLEDWHRREKELGEPGEW